MQAAGGGGPGRSPAVGPGRSSGGASSSSPSSSSSAISASHLGGFDAAQQQQYAFRQSLQQQQLRKSEGDETLVGYGVIGSGTSFLPTSGPMCAPQQSRRMVDLSQQQGSSQGRDEKLNQNSGSEQHVQNPMRHAYIQHAFPAAQQKSHRNMVQVLPQGNKMGVLGPPGKDQDLRMNNLKMQELMSLQAGNHTQASAFKKSSEPFGHGQKQLEQGQTSDSRPPHSNAIRPPVHAQQPATNIANLTANQFAMAQLQAMQAWAVENNIDLSHPNNANLIAQFLPIWQSRMVAVQKSNVNSGAHLSQPLAVKQQNNVSSPPVASENPLHGNPVNDLKAREIHSPVSFSSPGSSTMVNSKNIQVSRQPIGSGSGIQAMQPPQPLASVNQSADSSQTKNSGIAGPETLQVQYMKQMRQLRMPVQATGSSSENPGIQFSPQGGVPVVQVPQQHVGFTKQQLHVLKAQILAFRRLKLWSWERLHVGRPNIRSTPLDGLSPLGVRRNAKKTKTVNPHSVLALYRSELDYQRSGQVIWQPYHDDVLAQLPGICTDGAHVWLSRTPLICVDIVEMHVPDWVMLQFGLEQVFPPLLVEFIERVSRRGRGSFDWRSHHAAYITRWDDRTITLVQGEPAMTERDAYMRWYLSITRRLIMPPMHEPEMLYQPRGDTERALLTLARQTFDQTEGALVDRSYESLLAACQTLHDRSGHVLASLPLLRPVTEIPGLEVVPEPDILTSSADTRSFTPSPVVPDAPLEQVERPLSSKVYTRRQRALRAQRQAASSSDALPDVEPEDISVRERGRGRNRLRRIE